MKRVNNLYAQVGEPHLCFQENLSSRGGIEYLVLTIPEAYSETLDIYPGFFKSSNISFFFEGSLKRNSNVFTRSRT